MLQELASKIADEIQQEKKALEDRGEALEAREAGLEQKRKDFEEEKDKMNNFRTRRRTDGDVIEINVGGEVIATKVGTLMLAEATMLEAIFSGRWEDSIDRDASGRVFLDFSPVPFRIMLSYLRSYRDKKPNQIIARPIVPAEYKQEFETMIDYLELRSFLLGKSGCFSRPLRFKPAGSVLVDHGDAATTIRGGNASMQPVTSEDILSSISSTPTSIAWKISVKNIPTSGWFYAGIIGNNAPALDSRSDGTAHGWACSGQVYLGGVNSQGAQGWVGWQKEDTAVFNLDFERGQLVMFLQRDKVLRSTQLSPSQASAARMHFNIHAQGTEVEVTPASMEDIRMAGFA